MQPVALERVARHVDVDAAGMVSDGLARADVVGLRRIQVLHDVVEEAPFPDDVALHVHLDDRVPLAAFLRGFLRVSPGGDGLVVRDGLVGDVQRGRRVELLVEDANPIVMRRVVFALLGVFPDRLAVPIHLLEAGETAGVVLAGVEDVAVVEPVQIRPHRPRVDDPSVEVEEEGPVADAEERLAGECIRLVAIQQLGRALQPLVGVKWADGQKR